MRYKDVVFNKFLLRLSIVLGVSFLISFVLLIFQASELFGFMERSSTPPSNDHYESPTLEGYHLRMNATDYQTELFSMLITAHNEFNDVGNDATLLTYASVITQNFVADFFTLSNKESRNDVGGLQFFSTDLMENFQTSAIDNFYLHLNQFTEMFGADELPTVASTRVKSVTFLPRTIELEDNEDTEDIEETVRTMVVEIEWTFEETRLPYIQDFQTSGRFTLLEVEDEGVRIFSIEMISEDEYLDVTW